MYEKRANSIRKVIHMLTAFIWVKMDRAAGFNLMSAGDELFDGKLFMVKENLFINFMVSKSKKKNLKNSSFFQTKKIAEKRFPLRMQCKMLKCDGKSIMSKMKMKENGQLEHLEEIN